MEKLSSLGLNVYLMKWITEYLTNRSQRVVVEGETSSPAQVLSGVPQGSVLGPLLFLIYIDEVTTITLSQSSWCNLFADDLLLYKQLSNPQDLIAIQEDITSIKELSTNNYLTLNPAKCKYMIISRKRIPPTTALPLTLNSQPLSQVDTFKYLGVHTKCHGRGR